MIGQQFGSYRVVSVLGEGGMGVVYLAEHNVMGRKAAIKVLRPELTADAEIARRFINEATAASSIRHPGIVAVMDVATHPQGFLYILMEHLEGEDLGTRLRRVRVLEPTRAVAIVRQVLGALGAAHRVGIVHRDLKPDNLFIVSDPDVPGGERVKVLDFGIAKLAGDGPGHLRTRTGAMMGTPVYMSPEQCRGAGHVDHRSDLYSIGCILFEMLCGRPPFVGEGVGDLISSHMKEAPPRLRAIDARLPPGLDTIVARLLEKQPEARHASCDELIAELDRLPTAIATASPVAPTVFARTGAPGMPGGSVPRRWVIVAIAGALAAAGVAGFLLLGPGGRGANPSPAERVAGTTDAALVAVANDVVDAPPVVEMEQMGHGVLLSDAATPQVEVVELGADATRTVHFRKRGSPGWQPVRSPMYLDQLRQGHVVRLEGPLADMLRKDLVSGRVSYAVRFDAANMEVFALMTEIGPPYCGRGNKLAPGGCPESDAIVAYSARSDPSAPWTKHDLAAGSDDTRFPVDGLVVIDPTSY